MSDANVAYGLIRLFTEFPCVGTGDANFSIELQQELSNEAYEMVVKHIEFRRRCMNQGFDNLLELLELHHSSQQRMLDAVAAKEQPNG